MCDQESSTRCPSALHKSKGGYARRIRHEQAQRVSHTDGEQGISAIVQAVKQSNSYFILL